jgi:ribosomal protein S18 acetylase RimI-like enzyme
MHKDNEMIREWTISDLAQICTLLNQLSDDLHENEHVEINDIKAQFEGMKNDSVYSAFVYEEKGIIFGFISVVFYRSVFHKNGTALVNELVIHKNERGKGIGTKLLEFVINESRKRKMDEIEIGVMKENVNAINFYKQNGLNEEYYLLGKEFEY